MLVRDEKIGRVTALLDTMIEAPKSWVLFARSFDYLGATLLVGGTAFIAFLWPDGADTPRGRRLIVFGWMCAFVGTVASLCLNAAQVAGRPAATALDWSVPAPLLDVPFGRMWFARALLWLLALVVLADLVRRGRGPRGRRRGASVPGRSRLERCAPTG